MHFETKISALKKIAARLCGNEVTSRSGNAFLCSLSEVFGKNDERHGEFSIELILVYRSPSALHFIFHNSSC